MSRQIKRWRRLAALGLGLVVVACLTAYLLPEAPAQTKGEGQKKAEAKDDTPTTPTKVIDVMVGGVGGIEQVQYINDLLDKGWKDNKITPSERCSDYTFIRRASLDIIGRIAKPAEIARFLNDPENLRRSRLIERLLASDEFAHNWANIWTVLLLTRTNSSRVYQEQMRDWLREKLVEQRDTATKKLTYVPDWSEIVTALISAQGVTNDNGAVNFVLTHLGDAVAQDKTNNGNYEMVPVTSRTTRLFLGLRTQCVQCHDHPFNGEWQQHNFWGINAFFRQVDTPRGRPQMGKKKKGEALTQLELIDNPKLNPKGLVPYERRSGVIQYTNATFLDGKKLNLKDPGSTRRKELAKFIIDSPYFAKAYVNRSWAHFFGRSFTKDAPDDFGDHNAVSNEQLLDQLAKDWATKYRHNPKDLIRWICNSKAYGLSSVANKTNDKPDDELFFPRMLLKSMTPEQLFDSLMTATEAKVGQDKEGRAKLREEWLNKLIVNFGDDEGNEGSFNGTVVQALLLMNGQEINTAIMDKDVGTVAVVLGKHAGKGRAGAVRAIDELFVAALNRLPTQKELDKLLNQKMYALAKTPTRNEAAFWTAYYQDIFWAILNSNEFILNH